MIYQWILRYLHGIPIWYSTIFQYIPMYSNIFQYIPMVFQSVSCFGPNHSDGASHRRRATLPRKRVTGFEARSSMMLSTSWQRNGIAWPMIDRFVAPEKGVEICRNGSYVSSMWVLCEAMWGWVHKENPDAASQEICGSIVNSHRFDLSTRTCHASWIC